MMKYYTVHFLNNAIPIRKFSESESCYCYGLQEMLLEGPRAAACLDAESFLGVEHGFSSGIFNFTKLLP